MDKIDFIRECAEHNNQNYENRQRLKSIKWLNHTNISSKLKNDDNGITNKKGSKVKKISNFTKRITSKSAKQVLSDEWKRINTIVPVVEINQQGEEEKEKEKEKNMSISSTSNNQEILSQQPVNRNEITYFNVEAPPSILPTKKYCDITGLKANYRAPSNNLRYHNAEIYNMVIKQMLPGTDQQYLKLRKADVVLK